MNKINPFPILGYKSPEYFCDRQVETNRLKSALSNQRNVTLISLRKMGKTALIFHLFHSLNKNNKVIYLDLLPTSSLKDFINSFSKAIVTQFADKPTKIQTFLRHFSQLRPTFSIDPLTGSPNVQFKFDSKEEQYRSLEQLFDFIQSKRTQTVVAIDEFQQILKYPEKNIEALLRSQIQQLNNINFIFSGSNKHMLLSMFSDHGRPFYQSTELLFLDRIDKQEYAKFIHSKFEKANKSIELDHILNILDWTDSHTYYVQYFFNKLYELEYNEINDNFINALKHQILIENEVNYFNYRNLLTKYQFTLAYAIAKEGSVSKPTSGKFINRHGLKSDSSVRRGLEALLNKEIIYKENYSYKLYDIFFARWFEWRFGDIIHVE